MFLVLYTGLFCNALPSWTTSPLFKSYPLQSVHEMLNVVMGLMRVKGPLTDWLTWQLKGLKWLSTQVPDATQGTAHIGRHMHAAAQLHLASARCVSTLAGCTSSTVCTLNRLQQGQAWNAEPYAVTCSLSLLLLLGSPAFSNGASRQMPRKPLISGI